MFTTPAAGGPTFIGEPGRGSGVSTARWHSRVRGLPEVLGELPLACLAEEIDTPGEGRLRALVTFSGNPALSNPNGKRLEAALGRLECLVCVDFYLNETTRQAHVILPPPSPLERAHYDLAVYPTAVRNVANYSPPALPTPRRRTRRVGDRARAHRDRGPPRRSSRPRGARPAGRARCAPPTLRRSSLLDRGQGSGRAARRPRAALPASRGSWTSTSAAARTGTPSAPGREGSPSASSRRRRTGSTSARSSHGCPECCGPRAGRSSSAIPSSWRESERLAALVEAEPPDMLLVGRREQRSLNSWMHNLPTLTGGKGRCTARLHHSDVERLGLEDGQAAILSSRVGAITITVEASDDLMPGVVSVPHGWGHDAPGRSAARGRPGRPGSTRTCSRTSRSSMFPPERRCMNGIPVTVTPA